MKKLIKRALSKLGFELRKKSVIEDSFTAQKRLLYNQDRPLTIFDVGGYIGTVALEYNRLFPKSTIYSFEPYPQSYAKLQEATQAHSNIHTVNKGLGESVGSIDFSVNNFRATNSILKTHKLGETVWGANLLETVETISVGISTVDNFVQEHDIKKIDILKIDVQGAEYMVLNGAKESFEKGIIDLVYTEIITLPTYEGQIFFDELLLKMRLFGLELYDLYNYSYAESGQLRQVDAIFVSPERIKQS